MVGDGDIKFVFKELFSENDNVPNDPLPYASVMMGVTDGSGAGGRMKSVKITQNDMVYGIYMAPDQNFPVITGVLPPTKGKIDSGGKFGVGSGFTEKLKTWNGSTPGVQ